MGQRRLGLKLHRRSIVSAAADTPHNLRCPEGEDMSEEDGGLTREEILAAVQTFVDTAEPLLVHSDPEARAMGKELIEQACALLDDLDVFRRMRTEFAQAKPFWDRDPKLTLEQIKEMIAAVEKDESWRLRRRPEPGT